MYENAQVHEGDTAVLGQENYRGFESSEETF